MTGLGRGEGKQRTFQRGMGKVKAEGHHIPNRGKTEAGPLEHQSVNHCPAGMELFLLTTNFRKFDQKV